MRLHCGFGSGPRPPITQESPAPFRPRFSKSPQGHLPLGSTKCPKQSRKSLRRPDRSLLEFRDSGLGNTPPYRETDVAMPLSHSASCGIADYRCCTRSLLSAKWPIAVSRQALQGGIAETTCLSSLLRCRGHRKK